MNAEKDIKGTLMKARMFFVLLFLPLIIYAGIIYFIVPNDLGIAQDSVIIVLAVIALISLGLGYRLPHIMAKQTRKSVSSALVQSIIQYGAFESIGVYGLMLGIMGAGVQITLPFFLVAAGAMITVFPTEEKIKKLSGISDFEQPEIS